MDHQASITRRDLECMLLDETAEPKPLPLSLLVRITNGFSYKMEIGRGGFAVVYKGMLENRAIAVKKLSHTHMFEKEFFREVECLMKVKHKNIVRFLGYCSDTQGKMTMHEGKYVMADIQQRLLCFEYLPNGVLDRYIKDSSCGLEWTDRYDIIKGICEGLHHLHQLNIVHLDLKPANILLDENMEPKITDFGISRSFEEDQTRVNATKVVGTMGYVAPEFHSNVITKKYDLYSLGVIIMEILTGEKMYHDVETVMTREKMSHCVETVLKSWSYRLNTSRRYEECVQIRVCVEIAIECTDFDPANRPANMKHIIERLAKTERIKYYKELHPLQYRFYPELSDSIPCLLHVTNKTYEHVAFRLIRRSDSWWCYDQDNAMYGGVHPRSTCTLIMTTEAKKLAEEMGSDLVLQSSISGHKNIKLFKNIYTHNNFFREAEGLGHAVYEVALKAIDIPSGGEMASELQAGRPTIMKPIFLKYPELLSSLDAHPTEPWFVIGHFNGNVSIWNHESKTKINSFKISEESVYSIKFVATKKWIVALSGDKLIYVYDFACVTQIRKITSFRSPGNFHYCSAGIHPTKPYVLSPSMELWDGDKGWECTHIFGTGDMLRQHALFNPEDPNSFASVTDRHYVEVWGLDSKEPQYTLYGHSDMVVCLDFFKRGDRQYLITGSNDCSAKIWDLQKRTSIHTLEGIMSPVIHVMSLPGRPYLVTCSNNGTIHVWSSTDFRLKTTVNFSGGWHVPGIVCLTGSRRIAIGQQYSIAVIDIEDDEGVSSEGNTEDSQYAMGQSSNP